jgi:hypothetical protein
MRSFVTIFVGACLTLAPSAPVLAAPPPSIPAVAKSPPPANSGTGMLVWGSLGVTAGAAGIIGGTALWVGLGDGGGPLGAIPIVFGGGWLVLGSLGIHFGKQRRRALQAWEAEVGMDARTWRESFAPSRPRGSGVAMISAGITSVVAGASLTGVGFAILPPLASYEPREAPGALAMSIGGTIVLVSGAITLVMGSVQRHRYLAWHEHRPTTTLVPYPMLMRSGGGIGLTGSF